MISRKKRLNISVGFQNSVKLHLSTYQEKNPWKWMIILLLRKNKHFSVISTFFQKKLVKYWFHGFLSLIAFYCTFPHCVHSINLYWFHEKLFKWVKLLFSHVVMNRFHKKSFPLFNFDSFPQILRENKENSLISRQIISSYHYFVSNTQEAEMGRKWK